MNATTTRKATSFRFPAYLLDTLKQRAKENNRSLNSYVECLLVDSINEQPNAVTLAAINEAREGKSAGIANTESLEAFIKSCSE